MDPIQVHLQQDQYARSLKVKCHKVEGHVQGQTSQGLLSRSFVQDTMAKAKVNNCKVMDPVQGQLLLVRFLDYSFHVHGSMPCSS